MFQCLCCSGLLLKATPIHERRLRSADAFVHLEAEARTVADIEAAIPTLRRRTIFVRDLTCFRQKIRVYDKQPIPGGPAATVSNFFRPLWCQQPVEIEAHTRVLLVSDFEQRVAKLEAEDKQ